MAKVTVTSKRRSTRSVRPIALRHALPQVLWEHSGLTLSELGRYEPVLHEELAALVRAATMLYEDDHASMNLPLDLDHLRMCDRLAKKYTSGARGGKSSKSDASGSNSGGRLEWLFLVGIGGSNLGPVAVMDAVLGKMHNLVADTRKRPKVVHCDTVDPESMGTAVALLRTALRAKQRVLLSVASKSGTNTEPTANFEVLLRVFQEEKRDPKPCVVIITQPQSPLWDYAKHEGYPVLPNPPKVGGRYSVLCPVGLFPLAVMGVDTKKLLDGAAQMRAACLRTNAKNNPAMLRAAMIAKAHADHRNICDNFYFKTDLESIGKWYRQLMGESIGKEWDRAHTRQVWTGITPTVSIGSTDLHSMAQLYFGGPYDKFHTIIAVKSWRVDPRLADIHGFEAAVPNIQGRHLSEIMDAIRHGTQATFQAQGRPLCVIELPDSSEFTIGALLQLHMMEMMYLARILDVNPFDQPNVEDYKVHTTRLLAKK
jgi:glucose-6-phosphate isomerase